MQYPSDLKVNGGIVHSALLACWGLLILAAPAHAEGLIELEHRGPIAQREDQLILLTLGLMLIVVIPVLGMTLGFAWRYRAGNTRATYAPEWSSNRVDLLVWVVPTIIVAILAALTWIYTQQLNPYKPIDSSAKPLRIQVVGLDWKWLFIYPEQGIASVNQLVIPVDRPVSFDITSDTVMNSFFIPQLGGQIYAMAGMRTQLNLLADRPGVYFGENTQYSGRGFPYQHFKVDALPERKFEDWVKQVGQQGSKLDWTAYAALQKPSARAPVSVYTTQSNDLFERILAQYHSPPTSKAPPERSSSDVR